MNTPTFIASRDLGRAHFDFNTVGTIVEGSHGADGAAQFGLALSLQVLRKFAWMLESDGGPQPGTPDRYGVALIGATWSLKSWLVLDTAYARAYTAGSPRDQFTVGFTCAKRLGIVHHLPDPSSAGF